MCASFDSIDFDELLGTDYSSPALFASSDSNDEPGGGSGQGTGAGDED